MHTLLDHADLVSSCVVLGVLLAATLGAASGCLARARMRSGRLAARVAATTLPSQLCWVVLGALDPLVRVAVRRGVTANAITVASLLTGLGVGAFAAEGHFGVAGLLFVLASCGDALDGLVARASDAESPSGAILDASVDRYGEFFAFAGLIVHFRSNEALLALTLAALAGSFMVSYGSAQAEARHVAPPPGFMRRPERAACLATGLVLAPAVEILAPRFGAHGGEAAVALAVGVIAIAANTSAVLRIRAIAIAVTVARPRTLRSAADLAAVTRA